VEFLKRAFPRAQEQRPVATTAWSARSHTVAEQAENRASAMLGRASARRASGRASQPGGSDLFRHWRASCVKFSSSWSDIARGSAAMVLADIGERRLETIEVLYRGVGRRRIIAEFDEPSLEVGHIFPDLKCGAEFVSFRGISLRLELSGKSAGIFTAASSNVAKILCTAARSNGLSPLTMAAPILAWSPLAFIRSLRAFIGSCCAIAADTPIAIAVTIATASTLRIMW
jgi:hypothetical protein